MKNPKDNVEKDSTPISQAQLELASDVQRELAERATRQWWLLAVILLAVLMVSLDASIVNVAVPSIERGLRTNFSNVQLVVAGYTLAYAVIVTTGGRLGDLFGRKLLFILGVAGFTLTSLF